MGRGEEGGGEESMLFSSLGISRLIEFYFGRRRGRGTRRRRRGDIRICDSRGFSRAMHAQREGNINAPNFRVFDFREIITLR